MIVKTTWIGLQGIFQKGTFLLRVLPWGLGFLFGILWPGLFRYPVLADLPEPSLPLAEAQASTMGLEKWGNRIQLNGRTYSLLWGQWRTSKGLRMGVSDTGLSQVFGFELLPNSSLQNQPVQWFSLPPTRPLQLPTRLTGQARLLDITDLAEKVGWQLQGNASTLEIAMPPARVLAVRYGKQSWGDRLVLELDRPITWQNQFQLSGAQLTLDAQIAPELISAFQPQLSQAIRSLQVIPVGEQTQVRIEATLPARVWSLPNPHRLVIDLRPDALVERDIVWAPGLRWRSQLIALGEAKFPVTWLEMNPRQVGLQLIPILPQPDQMTGIAPLAETARLAGVAAAINGGFFNRNNQLPLGALRKAGRWFSGPILGRGAIAWNGADIQIGRLALQETLVLPGGRFPLTHLNSGYIQAGVARYTPEWGNVYTSLSNNEIVVTVQNNRVSQQQTLPTAGTALPIPSDGYLLVARSSPVAPSLLPVGTAITIESTTTPSVFNRYPNILAAGPLLIQNRQIVLDAEAEGFSKAFANQQASRSAIARTSAGLLLLVTIHNRINGAGPSLSETAQLLSTLQAVDALNLDGGSSTTLYLGGQVVDRPSNQTARVHKSLGISIQVTNP